MGNNKTSSNIILEGVRGALRRVYAEWPLGGAARMGGCAQLVGAAPLPPHIDSKKER